jgi:hypothetical protein
VPLPGLPDLSWYKIPKLGKYTKSPHNIPNGHKNSHGRKIDQMVIKYIKDFPLQDPPKFTKIGIFGLENKPSGNPGHY